MSEVDALVRQLLGMTRRSDFLSERLTYRESALPA